MHAIDWKKQAINDLMKIVQHIAKDSPVSADRMLDLIDARVRPLASHPRLGRAGRTPGTYELVAHENYIVIYRLLPNKIEILRVKHAAQRWPGP